MRRELHKRLREPSALRSGERIRNAKNGARSDPDSREAANCPE